LKRRPRWNPAEWSWPQLIANVVVAAHSLIDGVSSMAVA
jgi:hypothetical protein